MPINSARGSFSVKKHGHAMDSGVSSWIATYTYSPAPATEPNPRGMVLSVNPTTSTCYLTYLVTLSINTAWIGSTKTLSISENGTITDLTAGNSFYASNANPIEMLFTDPANPTGKIAGAGWNSTAKSRPMITNLSSGSPSGGYVVDYSASAANSYTAGLGDYVNSLSTYFYLCSVNGIDSDFGALTSTGTLTFSKYLKTSGGTVVSPLNQIKYNPVDGFIYVAGNNGAANAVLMKYSTAGVLQWQRQITTAGVYNFNSITFDDSGNIICFAHSNNASTVWYIASYSTSGVLNTSSSTTLTFSTAPAMLYSTIQKLPKESGGGYIISGYSQQGSTAYGEMILVLSSSFKPLSFRRVYATATTGALNAWLTGTYVVGGVIKHNKLCFDNYKNIYLPIHLNLSSVANTAPFTTYTGVLKIPLYGGGNTYTLGNGNIIVANLTLPTSASTTYTESAASLVEFTDSPTVSSVSFFSALDSKVPTLTRTSK